MAKNSSSQNNTKPTVGTPLRINATGVYYLHVLKVMPGVQYNTYMMEDIQHNQYTVESDIVCFVDEYVRCHVTVVDNGNSKSVSKISILKVQARDKRVAPPKSGSEVPATKTVVVVSPETSKRIKRNIVTTSPYITHKAAFHELVIGLKASGKGKINAKNIYALTDSSKNQYITVSNKEYQPGEVVICFVQPVKGLSQWHYLVDIDIDKTSFPVCKVGTQILSRKMLIKQINILRSAREMKESLDKKNEYSGNSKENEPIYNRKAAEVFEKMKDYGYHVCGKPFVCSCCHRSFSAREGYRADGVELYLCNSCKGGMKKRERKSQSVHAIFTPMGGQNK